MVTSTSHYINNIIHIVPVARLEDFRALKSFNLTLNLYDQGPKILQFGAL